MVVMNQDLTRAALRRAVLEEATGRRLPELNEPGWIDTSGGATALTGLDRQEVNAQARRYYHIDPIAQHLVRLHNAYTFGRGVSKKATDADINAWLERFWKHPRNRTSLTNTKAQWELGKNIQLDGELFFVFYTSTITGQVTVRTIPPHEIVKIVYAPDDPTMPIAYHHKYKNADGRITVDVLADYRIADLDKTTLTAAGRNTEVAVMHVVFEEFERRGISTLTTAVPWLKALRGFMEDRATLTLAWATYALRVGIKGNRQAMQRVAAQFQEYQSQLDYERYSDAFGEKERRQGGNTLMENDAMRTEQFKVDSGAANAYQDMRMFRQMGGIGAGISEHYLGDPSTGNLATATAMELPMLKLFEYEQEFWSDTLSEVLGFVLMQGVRYNSALSSKANVEVDQSSGYAMWIVTPENGADLTIEVAFPPIVQKDVAVWTSALAQVAQVESQTQKAILTPEARAMLGLQILGFGDKASGIIDELKQQDFAGPPPPPQPIPFPQQQQPDTIESLAARLTQKLRETKQQDIGKPLPKTDAQKVAPITKKEMQQAFEDFADMPSLADLIKELNVTEEELNIA